MQPLHSKSLQMHKYSQKALYSIEGQLCPEQYICVHRFLRGWAGTSLLSTLHLAFNVYKHTLVLEQYFNLKYVVGHTI